MKGGDMETFIVIVLLVIVFIGVPIFIGKFIHAGLK